MGICFEHDDELRGRMVRVITRRAAAIPLLADPKNVYLQKLSDGALLCFAEAAKLVWPELDTGSLPRSLLFESEEERASFTELARKLIGNVRITKPEDITYWVNRETLSELLPKEGCNPLSKTLSFIAGHGRRPWAPMDLDPRPVRLFSSAATPVGFARPGLAASRKK